jgi:hypothetical protein
MATLPSTLPKQQSYLLRLWPVMTKGQVVWQAYLEHIPSGESQGFAGLAQLYQYLENKFGCVAQEALEEPVHDENSGKEQKAGKRRMK